MMSGSGAVGPAVAARSLQQAQRQQQRQRQHPTAQQQPRMGPQQEAAAAMPLPLRPVSALSLLRRKRRRYGQHGGLPAADNAIDASNCSGNGAAAGGGGGNGAGPRLPPPLHLLLPPPPPPSAPAAAARRPRQPQGGGSHSPAAAANLSSTSSAGRGVGVHGGSVGGVFEIGPGITEVSGEAGSGKTQLFLRMCVTCALTPYAKDGDAMADGRSNRQRQESALSMPPVPAHTPAAAPAMVNSVRNPYAAPSQQVPQLQQQQQPRHNAHAATQYRQQPQQRQRRRCYRSVYVTMGEGLSPAQIAYRLGQMAEAAAPASSVGNGSSSTGSAGNNANAILRRILTRSVRNEDELLALVRNELPAMLRRGWDDEEGAEDGGRIGLVVLDSIAGLFRLPDGGAAKDRTGTAFFARRSEILFGLSAQLRKLGDQYGVAFVVANQVTAAGAGGVGGGGGGGPSGGGNATIPALGLSWSNCVNARFALRRSETLSSRLGVSGAAAGSGASSTANGNGSHQQQPQPQPQPVSMFKRWARVVKSPVLPPVSVPFTIDVRGGVATEYPK